MRLCVTVHGRASTMYAIARHRATYKRLTHALWCTPRGASSPGKDLLQVCAHASQNDAVYGLCNLTLQVFVRTVFRF